MAIPDRSCRVRLGRTLTIALLVALSASGLFLAATGSRVGSAGPHVLVALPPSVSAPGVTTYAVTFSQHALPSGAAWNVTILGQTWGSTQPTLVVPEPNGSYAYTASSSATPGNWSASGTFEVAGGPQSVPIDLTVRSAPSAGAAASTAGPGFGALAVLAAVGALVLVIVAAVLAVAGRRRGTERVSPPPAAPRPGEAAEAPPGTVATAGETPDPLGHML